jgi:hypothetical protein
VKRAVIAAIAVTFLAAGTARADGQLSLRQNFGGGWRVGYAPEAMFETGLRSELLFGARAVDAWRAGFALDLRTSDFVTVEAAGGGAILVPIAAGFPLVLSGGAGWASRPGGDDGPIALATIAFGYRAYNHHSLYGFALQAYVTGRTWLDRESTWEITFGVEVDLAFTLGVPFMFLYTWLAHGDPDEPEE